jgi:hypothetical protein
MRKRILRGSTLLAAALCLALSAVAQPKFEVSFPASAHAGPITGRVYVIITRRETPAPMQQIASGITQTPFFAVDVDQLAPGRAATVDASAAGYPLNSLKDVPAGDYFVQALINVYTQFHRSDGHTIWAHNDQWEGQQFWRSPGNIHSEIRKVHFDSAADIKLELTDVIPPIQPPADTAWVKHIKIQSAMLTKFWGQPIYLGAVVLLPKGYDEHPDQRYPTIYYEGHFSTSPVFGFSDRAPGAGGGRGQAGYQFYQDWNSDNFPRVLAVTLQHPTPYYDDSYAVNSANNGPYGDALLKEMIPYIEDHFRMIREPRARTLTGGSTGGWEALAVEVQHPDFFGGTWPLFPDPVDFRRDQLVNIYQDDNAFQAPGFEWLAPERPMYRTPEGQVIQTMRQLAQLEETLGSHGRSGQQFEAWESVYSPVGEDGYPQPLFDKRTGKIDKEVVKYMHDNGYDLSAYLQDNWARVGPQLKNKIHVYIGEMDSYYLNLAVYQLESFLKTTDANATFEYGRPLKGHGWQPMTNSELVKMMAATMQ